MAIMHSSGRRSVVPPPSGHTQTATSVRAGDPWIFPADGHVVWNRRVSGTLPRGMKRNGRGVGEWRGRSCIDYQWARQGACHVWYIHTSEIAVYGGCYCCCCSRRRFAFVVPLLERAMSTSEPRRMSHRHPNKIKMLGCEKVDNRMGTHIPFHTYTVRSHKELFMGDKT